MRCLFITLSVIVNKMSLQKIDIDNSSSSVFRKDFGYTGHQPLQPTIHSRNYYDN